MDGGGGGGGDAIKRPSIQEWTRNLNWKDKKVKTKHCHGSITTWFQLSRVNLHRNDLKRNKNDLIDELARGSSSRGFELSGVNCMP